MFPLLLAEATPEVQALVTRLQQDHVAMTADWAAARAGLLPGEPAAEQKAPAAGSDTSPKSSTEEPKKAVGSAPPGGGLLADERVAEVVKKGTDKVAWFLAKRGVLTAPPPPPEEALRTPPPVVDGKRVDSTGAQKASGADGTRLSKKDGL